MTAAYPTAVVIVFILWFGDAALLGYDLTAFARAGCRRAGPVIARLLLKRSQAVAIAG
jgi:hypothetical protein